MTNKSRSESTSLPLSSNQQLMRTTCVHCALSKVKGVSSSPPRGAESPPHSFKPFPLLKLSPHCFVSLTTCVFFEAKVKDHQTDVDAAGTSLYFSLYIIRNCDLYINLKSPGDVYNYTVYVFFPKYYGLTRLGDQVDCRQDSPVRTLLYTVCLQR